jgi:protein-S-isoprenylcysteine O-methyltransferase Ste14
MVGEVLLVTQHAAARAGLFALIGAGLVAEVVATAHGRRGTADGLGTNRGASRLDRGTKWVVVLGIVGGIYVPSRLVSSYPSLRVGANTWATYTLGLAILAAGLGLRVWAVWSLGRYFRREVTIVPGQTVQTSGPYRWIRHPAYLGDLLIVFGFDLAWGSWVGAALGTAIALAGHLPRIRVEEAELRRAFGESYGRYARGRARLVPGVW